MIHTLANPFSGNLTWHQKSQFSQIQASFSSQNSRNRYRSWGFSLRGLILQKHYFSALTSPRYIIQDLLELNSIYFRILWYGREFLFIIFKLLNHFSPSFISPACPIFILCFSGPTPATVKINRKNSLWIWQDSQPARAAVCSGLSSQGSTQINAVVQIYTEWGSRPPTFQPWCHLSHLAHCQETCFKYFPFIIYKQKKMETSEYFLPKLFKSRDFPSSLLH